MSIEIKTKMKALGEIIPDNKRALAWKRIGVIYLAYVRRKFVENSRGGGLWPPLKRKRKRNKSLDNQAILRDTGFLLQSLSVGAAGNFLEHSINSVTVGFGKVPHGGDNASNLREIAIYHNEGQGNLPQREILLAPDEITQDRMISELKRLFI